jgi:AcrR family transcriptional regulator
MASRHAIIDSGRALLIDEGLRGLTTHAIASRAGVSRKTLYTLFEDKRAMVEAIVVSFIEAELAAWDRILDSERPPMERVRASLRYVADTVPRIQNVLTGQLQRFDPELWTSIDALRMKRVKRLRGLFAELQSAGMIRADVDPDRWLFLLMQVVRAALHPRALVDSGYTLSELVETLIQLFYTGLLTERAREGLRPSRSGQGGRT